MSEKHVALRSESKVQAACRSFANTHGLDAARLEPSEAGVVFGLETVWEALDAAVAKEAERLIHDPVWGCVRTMLKKCRGHALSSVLLYAAGEPASAEVVSRTVIEASVNVMYILHRNRNERLGRYLFSYIVDQRDRVGQWEKSLSTCDSNEIEAHRTGIAQKRAALDSYEKIVNRAFAGCGFRFDPTAKFPKIFQRFRDIGEELGYRTEYMAISNQTHDAAEDLLNEFATRVRSPELLPMLDAETRAFSRMMVHVGTGYFFKACRVYTQAFDLHSAVVAIEQAIEDEARAAREAVMTCHNSV